MDDEWMNYQKAFCACMATLEPWDLEKVCRAHSITPNELTRFICACPVRRAKWREVSDTVAFELQNKKVK